MIFPAIAAVVLLIILLIFLVSPVRTKLIYRRSGQNDYLALELLLLWSRLPVRLELTSLQGPRPIWRPLVGIRGKLTRRAKRPVVSRRKSISVSRLSMFSRCCRHYLGLFFPVLKYMAGHTRLIQFRWETKIGFENAAATGIITGVLWTLKGTVSGILYRTGISCRNKPQLAIVPIYNQNIFNTELDCIFEACPGHIIVSGIKLIKLWLMDRMSRGSEHYARPAPN